MTRARSTFVRGAVLSVVLGLTSLTAVGPAHAEPQLLASQFKVNQADPESSVPTPEQAMRKPLEMGYFLMDLAELAQRAEQKSDYPAAIRFYRAMAKAVPDRSIAFSKQCAAYQALGNRKNALETCQAALGLLGSTAEDYARFVNVMVEGNTPLSATNIADVDAVVAHLQHEAKDRPEVVQLSAELACKLAMRLADDTRMRACTQRLEKLAPAAATTFTFRWARAMQLHDSSQVRQIIGEASRAGLPPALIAHMNDGLQALRAANAAQSVWHNPAARRWLVPVAVLLAALALLGGGLRLLRRRSGHPA